MVVVDDLDERLHLAALRLAGLGHAAGDLLWVALDSGDESVREGVGLAAIVLRLDDDDLLSCVTSTGDDGLFSTVLVYHLDVRYSRGIRFAVVCSEGGDSIQRTTRPTLRTAAESVYLQSQSRSVYIDSHFILVAVLVSTVPCRKKALALLLKI